MLAEITSPEAIDDTEYGYEDAGAFVYGHCSHRSFPSVNSSFNIACTLQSIVRGPLMWSLSSPTSRALSLLNAI
jgi:hypothetical protein